MTRVLYIAPEYPSVGANAAQVRANSLLPRLRSAVDVDLRILAFPPDGVNTVDHDDPTLFPVARRPLNKWALTLRTFSVRPRAFFRFDTPVARRTLRRLLKDFQPDVVHFDSIAALCLLDVVLDIQQRPKIIAHTHDAVSKVYASQLVGFTIRRFLNWLEYRKIARFEKKRLGVADLIIVDSDEDAAFLAEVTGDRRVATVPLGFDSSVYSPTGPTVDLDQPALVFSGSMVGVQSSEAALYLVDEVMPLVWRQIPSCHLYLVGNNPPPRMRALATDRVHVTGFVDEVASYLRAAAVYVCPLRLGSGMRTRVIEALACGAPVVATPIAVRGLAMQKESPPWLVADTADEFAAFVREVLAGKHPTLSNRAAAYALERYTWDCVAETIVRLYRDIKAK